MIFISSSIVELFGLKETQVVEQFDSDEISKIYDYSNKENDMYKDLNFKLRNSISLIEGSDEDKLYKSLEKSVKKIKLQDTFTLFRGMNIEMNFYNHLISQVGKYETLIGIISTSLNLEVSKEKYIKGNNMPIIFILTVSKGANCIPTFLFAKDKSEEEITFINLKMLINKVYKKDGITYFEATC